MHGIHFVSEVLLAQGDSEEQGKAEGWTERGVDSVVFGCSVHKARAGHVLLNRADLMSMEVQNAFI